MGVGNGLQVDGRKEWGRERSGLLEMERVRERGGESRCRCESTF